MGFRSRSSEDSDGLACKLVSRILGNEAALTRMRENAGMNHRRFRPPRSFGLRLVLCFFCLLCVGLACLSHQMRQAEYQRQLVDRLEKNGVDVTYDYEYERGRLTRECAMQNTEVPPESKVYLWFRGLLGDDFFFEIAGLRVCRGDFKDEDVRSFCLIDPVEIIDLEGTGITDASLATLSNLPNLRVLTLDQTRISGNGLAHLSRLASLETLSLANCQLTDADVTPLMEMKNLKGLICYGNMISESQKLRLKSELPETRVAFENALW